LPEPDIPVAYLMSVKDTFPAPRERLARTSRIDRWIKTDRGGHFPGWEEPQLTADDARRR
jgi:hypothetical protein